MFAIRIEWPEGRVRWLCNFGLTEDAARAKPYATQLDAHRARSRLLRTDAEGVFRDGHGNTLQAEIVLHQAAPAPDPEAPDGTRPRNLRELIAYLAEHPRVVCSSSISGRSEPERFSEYRDGGLWFTGPDGRVSYLPVACGLTAAESGLSFRPEGFVLSKFGLSIRYLYCEEKTGRGATP